ncbi:MAG: hypothetical protein U0031_19600 [Thermomicrobiales bacterium]
MTENQSDDGGGGIFNNFPGGLTPESGHRSEAAIVHSVKAAGSTTWVK